MTATVHAGNWLVLMRTCCNLSSFDRVLAKTPQEVTCDVCALRLLRTGQRLGLDVDQINTWCFEDLKRWTGEEFR